MKVYYEEKDLVTFGEYLLSKKRNDLIASNWKDGDSVSLAERQSQIYHADLENWKHEQKEKELVAKN